MLGSGGMARSHIDAFMHVRPISCVRVYSPTKENRERFAKEISAKHNVEVIGVNFPEDVYHGADIISGCASISGPIINGNLIQPGTHITCIGGTLDAAANTAIDVALRFGSTMPPLEAPEMRIDSECLTFAAGPRTKTSYGGTKKFSDIEAAKQISLKELRADPSRGRTMKDQITFSERGNLHGLQFYSVAGAVYESALTRGLGLELPGDDFLQTIRN
jgi:ornithine cyclodeaminase/alanine dehydrogenase-like protein (mu-crystallin family)